MYVKITNQNKGGNIFMREWILENTDVTEEEYDKLINPETITIEGVTTESNHTKSLFRTPNACN